jgi:acyl dehydratase
MRTIQFNDIDALQGMVSGEYGPWSDGLTVTQAMIDQFAELTGDQQWIHVDVDRARNESPFGATIAHGFLLLGLATIIKNTADYQIVGHSNALNYGLDNVRFVAPVITGSTLRGRTRINAVDEAKGGVMVTLGVAIHCEGQERPALVFDWKLLYR